MDGRTGHSASYFLLPPPVMIATEYSSQPAVPGSLPDDLSLPAQAEQLDRLRLRLMESQAQGGKPDPVLLAEYARAQQAFLSAKIQHERQRAAAEWEAQQAAEAQAIEAAAREAELAASIAASASTRRSKPLLSASRQFWVTIIVLLTIGAFLVHWPGLQR
jgi:hypothetical protein